MHVSFLYTFPWHILRYIIASYNMIMSYATSNNINVHQCMKNVADNITIIHNIFEDY